MVQLSSFDVVLIVIFFAITLFIGIYVSKQSGKSAAEYFLSGRNMPWWLLGGFTVATPFSTDTPNLATDIVRTQWRVSKRSILIYQYIKTKRRWEYFRKHKLLTDTFNAFQCNLVCINIYFEVYLYRFHLNSKHFLHSCP